ncbi:MAG: SAM-dependent methyltransferase [Candidatus Pacearchaeota archaeon]|nr:SAM-dependent methyltransferase [Candidatus Pacearchaeota archaeon]
MRFGFDSRWVHMPIFIIEHLEPKLWEWCFLEYKSISRIVGKKNLWFTNIKDRVEVRKLEKYGKVFSESVADLNLKKACLLDIDAKQQLKTEDNKKFKFFILGGILGDFPRKKRTKKELINKIKFNIEKRNLGKRQFSTDNAVYVTKQILDGKKLKKLKFKNKIEIRINDIESIILPFSYPLVNNKPRISEELVSYLKKKKDF